MLKVQSPSNLCRLWTTAWSRGPGILILELKPKMLRHNPILTKKNQTNERMIIASPQETAIVFVLLVAERKNSRNLQMKIFIKAPNAELSL